MPAAPRRLYKVQGNACSGAVRVWRNGSAEWRAIGLVFRAATAGAQRSLRRLPTWSAPTTCRRSAIAIRFGLQLFHVKRRVKGGVMWRRLFRAGVTRKVPPHHSPAMPTPTTLQPAKHLPRRNSSRATEDPRRNQNFSPVSRGPACAPGASTIPAGSLRRAHFLTAQLEGDHVSRETRRNAYPSLHTNSSGSRCRNRHDLPSMIRAE